MYIDTHAHLDFPEFKAETAALIGRAHEAGVDKILNVAVDLETSKSSTNLSRLYPEIYSTIGIHPHSAFDLDLQSRPYLMQLSAQKKVVAIGEIGLDYYYLKRSSKFAKYPKREDQIFCFEQMLDLSIELRLPVVIHCREAEDDLYAVLKSFQRDIRGVIHNFSGSMDFCRKILDLGMAVSFTGRITFKNNSDSFEVIKNTPLGSIMIETDCPYLAPEPHRGQRNEPAYVVEVAKEIARIKDLPLSEVEIQTTKKAETLFRMK